jgi:hypothetical protein
VKATSDQGDVAVAGKLPIAAGGSEDTGPEATGSEAAASKEESKPPESKALTTKVWHGGCARNSGTPACLSNVPSLIKNVSSAEGWIQGRQRGKEGHQGIKRQGARNRREGEEAWCHLAERLLSSPRTVHKGGNNA